MMGCVKRDRNVGTVLALVIIFASSSVWGFTDPTDVMAINGLFASLHYPPLPGWASGRGDPCGDNWQGVKCVIYNITEISITSANLEGELNDSLGLLSSIIKIDLSNNRITGSIPSMLPSTIQSFFLSANQLTGSVPETLSNLGQLTALSLNDNHLTGVIPDSFRQLTGLVNLDLSGNNLSGPLPPSMGNLSSLATLHLQNNRLVGTLDVLEDLHLSDLNVENNLFSGPIPPKLLSIPNFRRNGNPFNTTVIPTSPPALPPSPFQHGALPPELAPPSQPNGLSPNDGPYPAGGKKFMTSKSVVWISIAVILIVTVLALVFSLLLSRCRKERQLPPKTTKKNKSDGFGGSKNHSNHDTSLLQPYSVGENVPTMGNTGISPRSKNEYRKELVMHSIPKQREDHAIDMSGHDKNYFPQPQQSPRLLPIERLVSNPIVPPTFTRGQSMKRVNSTRSFTIASLQQYTNSFSPENFIGKGMLGSVYRAELPYRNLLAVKKLDVTTLRSEKDFLDLLSTLSKLQHDNLVGLVGYCAEHGQRLLVYEYCRNGTLYEALHLDDEIKEKLSWNARTHLALQAAKALEYLHEVCEPPIVHRNFKSANVLLNDNLAVRISDCGLGPLLSSSYLTHFQASGYGAPELEVGSYTCHSDVYSFGVVMLELLTGRKAHDRSRPRGEQFLVRWAIPQLHDIDALSRMVDPSLNGSCPSFKSLSHFADVISLCLQPEPEFRPPMSEIVQSLLNMIQRET